MLEVKVEKAVLNGGFKDFARKHLGEDIKEDAILWNCHLSGLWLAVHNNVEGIRYGAMNSVYGDREIFQRHGIVALKNEEACQINRSISHIIEPFQEAYRFLSKYKENNYKVKNENKEVGKNNEERKILIYK
tara:strand:- start:42 stop:437 length:396 start_codon:yes stop_codon:yes gene_type:complete